MSINSLFGTASLALQASQTAMQTASHNIANANVEGYSRQTVALEPNYPFYTPFGAVGTGVVVSNVSRVRDGLLDTNYRDRNSQSSAYSARRDVMSDINGIYGEPSDTGLANQLDKFWSSWGDLANNPSSTAAKSTVQQNGAAVASTLNRFASSLSTEQSGVLARANGDASDLTRYASQVASLNGQIVAAEADGHAANDLRDLRDKTVDAMSKIAPVTVLDHPNGSITLYVAGAVVADGIDARSVSVATIGGGGFALNVGTQLVKPSNLDGSLGAELGALNTDIPQARQQLDAIAASLVSTVNTIHRAGWTASGDALGGANWNAAAPPTGSNVNFFDPTKVNAASISLSTAVASDASTIAAGDAQNAPGNNNVANRMAALRTATTSMTKWGAAGTTSFSDYYRDTVTRAGIAGSDASSSATVYATLASQADTQRKSVSGVSTDDELIELTKRQQSYAAAAKIITAASQMSQTLLEMIPAN